ncbi:MAG: hypothetical protein ACREQN_16900 [Candidatus Binataceae bacterium]
MAAVVLLTTAAGCSLFHHSGEPPQEQFLQALKRGNAPQASQIWLHMSADDRANLSHGIGINPKVTRADVESAFMKHQVEAEKKHGQADSQNMGLDTNPNMGLDANQNMGLHTNADMGLGPNVEQNDSGSQQVDLPGVGADQTGGSLLDLPHYLNAAPTAPVAPSSDDSQ